MKTVSIIVSGKVQGVYYRQSTKEKAKDLHITGTVKNMPDATVHIIATGEATQLEQLIAWCKQGPSRAKVAHVVVEEKPLQPFEKFTVER